MNKTIMIVEDEQTFHDLYKIILEEADYKTTHTYSGEEAFSKLKEEKPDLIILDIVLDTLTGNTLLQCLKGMPEYKDIPVILISALSEKYYKDLRKIDPNLVCIEKSYLTKEMLLEEIDKKLIERFCSRNRSAEPFDKLRAVSLPNPLTPMP